jgi:hypothetical protein
MLALRFFSKKKKETIFFSMDQKFCLKLETGQKDFNLTTHGQEAVKVCFLGTNTKDGTKNQK